MEEPIANTETDQNEPELLTVHQVGQLLNCSARHVYRLADRSAMPRPVRLGTLVRWRRDEIEQWITAGCPSRWTAGMKTEPENPARKSRNRP